MKTLTKNIMLIALTSTAIISTPITSVFAADENAPFHGPYIGGALTLNKSNTNATVTPTAAVTLDSKSKVAGGIYAGYGAQLDFLYFGAEGGFYLNGNPNPTAAFGATGTGLKSKNTIDLSARAGFVAQQALIYGLAGYTATQYETFGLVAKNSKRIDGFRYGGGIEFAISPEMSLRGEYTHANYKEWNVVSGANTINFEPSEHRFLVGASLRF